MNLVGRKIVVLVGDEGFYRFIRNDYGYVRQGQPVVKKSRFYFDKNNAGEMNYKYCSYSDMKHLYNILLHKGYKVFPNASELEYIGQLVNP